MITGITYHHLKAKIFLLFVCFRCFLIPVYGSDLAELPDTFHITKAESQYYDDIGSFREYIRDSIDNPKAYWLNMPAGIFIAIEKDNKYLALKISDDFSLEKNHFLERKNINNTGNDELIIHWYFTTGGSGHSWSQSSISVWDIDACNCLLGFENQYGYESWWNEFDEEIQEITMKDYSLDCYNYAVEFTEMQMTIQLIAQDIDNECVDVNGEKYVYKLTKSGFVLDRKEKAELGNKENK